MRRAWDSNTKHKPTDGPSTSELIVHVHGIICTKKLYIWHTTCRSNVCET